MKTKQKAIKIFYDRYGCDGYNDLVKALNDGWIVKRMDHLYNNNGMVKSNVYIVEKEVNA